MNDEQIKEIALANGFKLKDQGMAGMDLNPYVYDFARALLAAKYPVVTLNGYQLKDALAFIAPDGDAEQMESEISIAHLPAGKVLEDDGSAMPEGVYAWITDYPEEGTIPLSETSSA